jgi:hypothetical protein
VSDPIDIGAQRRKLRRVLAGKSIHCISAKHEAALLVWRAAEVADRDPDKPADFLEMAAQCVRRKED